MGDDGGDGKGVFSVGRKIGLAETGEVWDENTYEPIDWNERGDSALNLWGPLPPPEWRDYGVPILAPRPDEHVIARH